MNSITQSNKEFIRTLYGQEGILLCDTGDTKMHQMVPVLEELTISQKYTNNNTKPNKEGTKRFEVLWEGDTNYFISMSCSQIKTFR